MCTFRSLQGERAWERNGLDYYRTEEHKHSTTLREGRRLRELDRELGRKANTSPNPITTPPLRRKGKKKMEVYIHNNRAVFTFVFLDFNPPQSPPCLLLQQRGLAPTPTQLTPRQTLMDRRSKAHTHRPELNVTWRTPHYLGFTRLKVPPRAHTELVFRRRHPSETNLLLPLIQEGD